MICELRRAPKDFFDSGCSYDLLECYFDGWPIFTLSELLTHENLFVKRVAIWIVSELGENSAPLIKHVLPLLNEDNRHIKFYALEAVMLASSAGNSGVFHFLVSALEDQDTVIREHAMFLISNGSDAMFEEAMVYFSRAGNQPQLEGLKRVLINSVTLSINEVVATLYSDDKLEAMYSAIIIRQYTRRDRQNVFFDLNRVKEEATIMFLEDYIEQGDSPDDDIR